MLKAPNGRSFWKHKACFGQNNQNFFQVFLKIRGQLVQLWPGGGSSFLIILLEFEIQGQFGYSEFGTHKITSRKGSV
jgi:hypothetical protein